MKVVGIQPKTRSRTSERAQEGFDRLLDLVDDTPFQFVQIRRQPRIGRQADVNAASDLHFNFVEQSRLRYGTGCSSTFNSLSSLVPPAATVAAIR